MAYDTADYIIDIEQMVSGVPLDAQSIELNPILTYIPIPLWPQVFKTFILGYGCIMKVIAQLLSCFILPMEPVIRAELQNGQIDYFEVQAANFYFRKGGRVEYALAAIVDGAEASFVDLQGAARLLSTPSCVNDREFGIVRKNLGLNPQQTWGPYSIMPQPTTWTTDSDDSEEGEDDEEEGDDDGDDGQDEDDEGRDDDDDQDQ
jgi:hypothetical protein